MALSVAQFASKIKQKYPAYKDVDDLELATRMVEKYPVYKERVTFEAPPEVAGPPELTAGLTPEQTEKVQRMRASEETIPGKALELLRIGQPMSQEMAQKFAQQSALSQQPLPQRLAGEVGGIVKPALTEGAKIAPLLLGGPVTKLGRFMLGGPAKAIGTKAIAKVIGKEAAAIGGVTGLARTGEEVLRGAELPEAAKKGYFCLILLANCATDNAILKT